MFSAQFGVAYDSSQIRVYHAVTGPKLRAQGTGSALPSCLAALPKVVEIAVFRL
jgi:hypothetical protein